MSNIIARYEDPKFMVYNNDTVWGSISFDENKRVSANIFVDGEAYRAEPESEREKDIVLKKAGITLFKFKFDYLWGGAELQANGEDTGYEITGKFFKPGTRLVDAVDKDLVVVVSNEQMPPEISIKLVDEAISPLLIMATLYYHIYTSASKTRSVMMNS